MGAWLAQDQRPATALAAAVQVTDMARSLPGAACANTHGVRGSDWEIDEDLVETRVYFEPPADALPSAAFRLARPSPAPLDVTVPRPRVERSESVYVDPVDVPPIYVAPPQRIVAPPRFVAPATRVPLATPHVPIAVPRAPIVAPKTIDYTPTEPVDFARHIAARGTRRQTPATPGRSRWTLALLYGACIVGSALIAWAVTAVHAATDTAPRSTPAPVPTVSSIAVPAPHDAVVRAPTTKPMAVVAAQTAPVEPTVAATVPVVPVAPVAPVTPPAAPQAAPQPTVVPHGTPTRAVAAPHALHRPVAVAAVAKAPAPAPVAVETGTLDISSKPPCTITIDDKATGMMTPRRDVELPIGKHQVTLTNADEGIQLTTDVVITSGHTTKLIRDFMQ